MKVNYKIAFIIPWFGPFPKWMSAYLISCQYNETVNFYIYTDSQLPDNYPKNVHFIKTSFQEYCDLVSKKLNIKFKPRNPYKLCDIKPALGKVHKEELSDYDFWGFCDIDIILGNIRSFLSDKVLTKYDFYSTHGSRVAGHFTIMRNSERWRNIFMKRPDWKKSFESQQHLAFDEKSFSKLFIKFKNMPLKVRTFLCKLFISDAKRAYIKEMYSTPGLRYDWVDGSRDFPTEWYWKSGTLTNNKSDKEFLYFHFLDWKKQWSQSQGINYIDSLPEGSTLVISENGFSISQAKAL